MRTETVPDPPVVPIAANAHANRLARNADTTTPLPPPKPVITLSTQIEYRGRSLTVTASGMTLDAFYAAVDARDDDLFTISANVRDGQRRTMITASHMTIDGFCDMLDKRLGVPS